MVDSIEKNTPGVTPMTGAPETQDETGGRRGRGAQSKSPANAASKGPVAVASFPPNGYGLFDMAGNVWEWVNDWHETNYYSISPLKNPQGPATGEYKVFRGGGWIDTEERNQMPSFRNYTDPLQKSPTIGFRCAKSLQLNRISRARNPRTDDASSIASHSSRGRTIFLLDFFSR